ncbi:hypothetical protein J6590_068993 [Homalodisca vitripennis]|nr:hypothetical protein J6590_068993 [Homalodisca vitripennis]
MDTAAPKETNAHSKFRIDVKDKETNTHSKFVFECKGSETNTSSNLQFGLQRLGDKCTHVPNPLKREQVQARYIREYSHNMGSYGVILDQWKSSNAPCPSPPPPTWREPKKVAGTKKIQIKK